MNWISEDFGSERKSWNPSEKRIPKPIGETSAGQQTGAGGASENSPAFQRRVRWKKHEPHPGRDA
jgi:hypothetical protein